MNKKKKGRTLENKVNEFLKRAGWTTKQAQSKLVFIPDKKAKEDDYQEEKKKPRRPKGYWISKEEDIWGADILAIKENHINLAIQVTSDSALTQRAVEFAKYPYGATWLTLIIQPKKKHGVWQYYIYHAWGGNYTPLERSRVESIFGDMFYELDPILWYLEKMTN